MTIKTVKNEINATIQNPLYLYCKNCHSFLNPNPLLHWLFVWGGGTHVHARKQLASLWSGLLYLIFTFTQGSPSHLIWWGIFCISTKGCQELGFGPSFHVLKYLSEDKSSEPALGSPFQRRSPHREDKKCLKSSFGFLSDALWLSSTFSWEKCFFLLLPLLEEQTGVDCPDAGVLKRENDYC